MSRTAVVERRNIFDLHPDDPDYFIMAMVPVEMFKVQGKIQRRLDGNRSDRIAGEFQVPFARIGKAMLNHDGTYEFEQGDDGFIYLSGTGTVHPPDGQHTADAIERCGGTHVPVQLFVNMTYERGGEVYSHQHDNVRQPSIKSKVASALETGDPAWTSIQGVTDALDWPALLTLPLDTIANIALYHPEAKISRLRDVGHLLNRAFPEQPTRYKRAVLEAMFTMMVAYGGFTRSKTSKWNEANFIKQANKKDLATLVAEAQNEVDITANSLNHTLTKAVRNRFIALHDKHLNGDNKLLKPSE